MGLKRVLTLTTTHAPKNTNKGPRAPAALDGWVFYQGLDSPGEEDDVCVMAGAAPAELAEAAKRAGALRVWRCVFCVERAASGLAQDFNSVARTRQYRRPYLTLTHTHNARPSKPQQTTKTKKN